ncbi:hypothetical protein KI657_24555, partial [Vibrio sp. D406a]|nr:hypothetical protein [Vibrio sp. D406a]
CVCSTVDMANLLLKTRSKRSYQSLVAPPNETIRLSYRYVKEDIKERFVKEMRPKHKKPVFKKKKKKDDKKKVAKKKTAKKK